MNVLTHGMVKLLIFNNRYNAGNILNWVFGIIVFAIGLANLLLVHPAPGIIFLLLSLIYFPFINNVLRKKYNFSIPFPVKLLLAIAIIMFTLGVSDLGDIIDKSLA